MQLITDELIKEVHKENWAVLTKKYKTETAVPFSEVSYVSEIMRGMYVLQIWQREGGQRLPQSYLNTYSVQAEVSKYLLSTFIGLTDVQVEIERTEKRKDKWTAFERWSSEHQAEQFTSDQLTEQSGFSYQTTLTYLKESSLFRKIKNGLWEVTMIPKREK